MFYNIKPGDTVTTKDAPGERYTVKPFTWNLKRPNLTQIPCQDHDDPHSTSIAWAFELVVLPPPKKQPAMPPFVIKLGDIVRVKGIDLPAVCPKPAEMRVVSIDWKASTADESTIYCEWFTPGGTRTVHWYGLNDLEVIRRGHLDKPPGLFRPDDVVVLKDGHPYGIYDVTSATTDTTTWQQRVTIRHRLNGYISTVDGDRLRLYEPPAEPATIGVGDTVRLRSGGPAMTIAALNGNEAKLTYAHDGVFKYIAFALPLLEKV